MPSTIERHAEERPTSASRSARDLPCSGSRAPVAERVLAQKIEIAAAIGLQDLAAVEPGIAALRNRRRRGFAARQFVWCDQQVDPALLDRKPDSVAVAHLGERAP